MTSNYYAVSLPDTLSLLTPLTRVKKKGWQHQDYVCSYNLIVHQSTDTNRKYILL